MKKITILFAFMLTAMTLLAQTTNPVEVLYFKASLSCCKARACSALEADIQNIVQKNYTDGSVIFKEIKIADETNKSVVQKYNAQSQTVVLSKKTKKREVSSDVSEIVKAYIQDQNREIFENKLLAAINDVKKRKK